MFKHLLIFLFTVSTLVLASTREIYNKLENINLKYSTFKRAITGYNKISPKKDGLITIIDFSMPSNRKRFFVIDLNKSKILYNTLVSHGKNSGLIDAIQFSNVVNSLESSLGFYITGNPYTGKFGYSLKLIGLEKNINDNALIRTVVLHGAKYSTQDFIDKYGFLGRSLGCPSIPDTISDDVINLLQGGTVLFINANDEYYNKTSKYI